MFRLIIFSLVIIMVSSIPQEPILSASYSNVYYQPEIPIAAAPEKKFEVEADKSTEFTTEPESEQINFAIDNTKEKFTELSDLNDQRVYFIYHPNKVFQKVVYAIPDEQENREINYVLPIKEPILEYDPRTFVFQRLVDV